MQRALPCPSPCRHHSFSTSGRTAHQVNRDLRKALAQDLQRNVDREAFSSNPLPPETPRADEIEELVASFSGLHELSWLKRQPPPPGNMDLPLWRKLHTRNCRAEPPCTAQEVNRKCYFFFFIHLMLLHGFLPAYVEGKSKYDI